MNIFPACLEHMTSPCITNSKHYCFVAYTISVIVVGILSLVINIISLFVTTQVSLGYLILNALISFVLIVLGIHFLISQSNALRNYVRAQDEAVKLSNHIQCLDKQILGYQDQVTQLEDKVRHLDKSVDALKQENTFCINNYLAELDSRDKYEFYIQNLTRKLQEVILYNS
ncbi:hypothetical protein BOKEGFJH_00558 [Chlamydia avium]|uniref:IncA family protein n=1 Tax=Chlamydia avium TaxID=1457141 RepID=A0ABP2X715_9CHLA|nr:hypothetical protein [Chlamydia avium]EPP36967.1 hypothetical protein CP10743SC13_0908 [Chlamydia psittaci 10_743_SC13]EPP38585.1 hypothetical protein CP10881SC42_0002 [Chlamydia avium]VVT43029.1 hypothetical protein BOKEGFJH_00558 [Chlamydia avium]